MPFYIAIFNIIADWVCFPITITNRVRIQPIPGSFQLIVTWFLWINQSCLLHWSLVNCQGLKHDTAIVTYLKTQVSLSVNILSWYKILQYTGMYHWTVLIFVLTNSCLFFFGSCGFLSFWSLFFFLWKFRRNA